MTWTEIAALVTVASAIGAFLGWLLPSPIQMQDRIAKLEKELAVLVNTVDSLRQTVTDWIRFTREQGNNHGDSGGSGRRSRL